MTYTNKTQATTVRPQDFLEANYGSDERIVKEALALVSFFEESTGWPCVMWGKIFGFGKYHYLDSRGGKHDYLVTGFAIAKTGFTLYNMLSWKSYEKDIEKLGKYKLSGKSCLAIRSIEDIDLDVLRAAVKNYLAVMRDSYEVE